MSGATATDLYPSVIGDLTAAGCTKQQGNAPNGDEYWYSPVNNTLVLIPPPTITSKRDANSALRRAGLPARF